MKSKPRQYTVWSLAEEHYLRALLWRGVAAEKIAEHLGRSASAVLARMKLIARQDEQK